MKANGVAYFQDFGIGDRSIGHVCMNGVTTRSRRGRTTAPTYCFIVAEVIIAKDDIVHGSLRAGSHTQRLEQDIDQSLAGFHVTTDYRRACFRCLIKRRMEHPGWQQDFDRLQEPFIEWDVFLE